MLPPMISKAGAQKISSSMPGTSAPEALMVLGEVLKLPGFSGSGTTTWVLTCLSV